MTSRTLSLLVCVSLATAAPFCKASTYNFDLTDAVAGQFQIVPDAVIDLGVEFQHIDSATVHLTGNFTPGLVTSAILPGQSGPTFPSDTVDLITRLDEVGTSWIDKDTYAIQSLRGFSGPVAFTLPLKGNVHADSGLPVLMPGGDGPPDFGFLLDGHFAISVGPWSYLASIYRELQSPHFELSSFVLQVDGSAVPEPSTLLLVLAAGIASMPCRRR